MKVLVTGASGFIASALMPALVARGHAVRAATRQPTPIAAEIEACQIDDIGPATDWSAALSGVDAVIHLAARAHVLQEAAVDPLAAFRAVNTQGTLRLAEAAARHDVGRFVFVSSIGVNGDATPPGAAFHASSPANPRTPYAQSKWEAEQGLAAISANTGMATVVLRPPLVYGPGAPGNFRRLLHWVECGVPLPLAGIENRRSLIFAGNLASAMIACLEHPEAAGRTFLVADGAAISTPDLIRALAEALGRPARLFAVPESILMLACRITGRDALARRLLGSLVVDDQAIRQGLGWSPPYRLDQGLAITATAFGRAIPIDRGHHHA